MASTFILYSLVSATRSSEYVLALLGAGLSAPSGVPTFRGDGSLWRARDIKSLATRHAFAQDPVLVWQFYEDRRRNAVAARPNPGHYALAELASTKTHFLAITQNIDGLSERASHEMSKLAPIHGSLLIATCHSSTCSYMTWNCGTLPLVSALQLPVGDVSDLSVPLPIITPDELPRCPQCGHGMLRPGVVWFGEQLPEDLINRVDEWLDDLPRIDLMLVIGTSARVFPAAEYVSRARAKGARVAHFNIEFDEELMCPGDWCIIGDEDIIKACRNPQRESIYKKARLEIIKIGRSAIKFGTVPIEEAHNQIHAHKLLDVVICRVPYVHDYFHKDGIDYLVMEYAEGKKKTVADKTDIDNIANIVNHLHGFISETPGPVTSGVCRGPLWSQDELVSFNTKQDLVTYVNSRLRKDSVAFKLSEDPLVLVHGDIALPNFIFGQDYIWLLDWEFAGYFPRSAEIATLCMGIGEDQKDLCFSSSVEQTVLRTRPLLHYEALEVQLWQQFALNHVRCYWPTEEEKAFLRNRRRTSARRDKKGSSS